MENRKVVNAISKLSVKDLNRFIKYLHSPYFNTNDKLVKLGSLIVDNLKYGKGLLSDEQVWNKLFSPSPYDDKRLRKAYSDLLKLFINFINIEIYQNDERINILNDIRAIMRYDLNFLRSTVTGKVDRYTKYNPERSASFHYFDYEVRKGYLNLISEFEKKKKSFNFENEYDFNDIIFALDEYYYTEKLRFLATGLSLKNIRNYSEFRLSITEIIEKIDDDDLKSVSSRIYFLICKIQLDNNNEKAYRDVYKLMENNFELFQDDEIRDIFDAIISFCIVRVNQGDRDYLKELFSIYKTTLKIDAFYVNGYLSPTSFRNISGTALRLKEYEWCEKFIHKFYNRLEEKYQQNALHYNLALLYFYKREYQKVLENLHSVVYEDVIYNLNSKTILLASYYELQEFEALDSLINSFKVFISREKTLSNNRKRNYLNYLKYTKRISKLSKRDISKLEKLKNEITETRGVVSKSWLLEKIDEKLEKKSVRL